MQILVQIISAESDARTAMAVSNATTMLYLRRVETDDLDHTIRQMDQALSAKKRKRRSDSQGRLPITGIGSQSNP